MYYGSISNLSIFMEGHGPVLLVCCHRNSGTRTVFKSSNGDSYWGESDIVAAFEDSCKNHKFFLYRIPESNNYNNLFYFGFENNGINATGFFMFDPGITYISLGRKFNNKDTSGEAQFRENVKQVFSDFAIKFSQKYTCNYLAGIEKNKRKIVKNWDI